MEGIISSIKGIMSCKREGPCTVCMTLSVVIIGMTQTHLRGLLDGRPRVEPGGFLGAGIDEERSFGLLVDVHEPPVAVVSHDVSFTFLVLLDAWDEITVEHIRGD